MIFLPRILYSLEEIRLRDLPYYKDLHPTMSHFKITSLIETFISRGLPKKFLPASRDFRFERPYFPEANIKKGFPSQGPPFEKGIQIDLFPRDRHFNDSLR